MTLVYGAGTTIKIDLLIVQGPDSRLLVDDTQCTGRGPVTSIYAPELVGCA